MNPASSSARPRVDDFSAETTTSPNGSVLVADDDPSSLKVISTFVQRAGFRPVAARNGLEAIRALSDDILVAVLDLRMPEASGHDVLLYAKKNFPDIQVIIVTGSDELSDAIEMMKSGAADYMTKPYNTAELENAIKRAHQTARLSREHRGLKAAVGSSLPVNPFVCVSQSARALMEQVDRVSSLASTVLLTGESGSGKTAIARLIHTMGERRNGPFVSVNCAALPRELIEAELFGHARGAFTGAIHDRPGRVEIADGGTLFLDEIGDLPFELQPKLLTFLQDRTVQRIGSNQARRVNVRLIAASHQDLPTMCVEGRFRQDLYYRLNVLSLEVPPLRNRRADIGPLAEQILSRINSRMQGPDLKLELAALEKLAAYHWPGNVRELENVLERAAAFCKHSSIQVEEILPLLSAPEPIVQLQPTGPTLAGMTLREIERRAIIETLDYCGGNKARTARELGISEKSIYNKMRRLDIKKQS